MSGRPATVNVIPGKYALAVGPADMPTPRGWRWVALTAIARLESGHTPSREHSEYWNGDIGWIGIKDARAHHGGVITDTLQTVTQAGIDNSAARLLPAGTVCLSRTASVGYVVVMGREMATSQDFVNWVCGPDLDPHFLKQLFIAENESLFRFGKGTTHTTVYFPEVKAFHVCLPPIGEQRRIVKKAESLQARSRRAREALDAVPPLLEKLRQSILAAAFRGDLTKDWRAKHPDVEPASELLERLRAERRKKWEDSELAKATRKSAAFNWESWKAKYKEPAKPEPTGLPPLPAGWRWTTFETVGEVDLGRQRAPQYQTGRFPRPYLRVANVKDDRLDLDDVLEMDFDEDDFRHYQLRHGDILISEGQSPELVGQSAIYRGGIDGLCFQKTLHRFRPAAGFVSPEYAQLVCRLYLRDGTFRAASSLTVNIAHLTLVRLKPLRFPLAPFDEQGEIVRRAHAALGRVRSLEDGAEALTELRGSLDRALLAKAFRGELVPHPPNIEPRTTTPCEEADRNKRVAPDGSHDVAEAG